jgi:hypothetical protein
MPPDEPEVFPAEVVASLRREAADRRRELRAAEERLQAAERERDELRGELNSRLLAEALRDGAATVLADPADLLVFGEREALLGDDGRPSVERVATAARELARSKPHLAARRPDFDGGVRETARARPDITGALREVARG